MRKLNKAKLARVRKMVEKAEAIIAQRPDVYSVGPLWVSDVKAIRYLLDRLVAEQS